MKTKPKTPRAKPKRVRRGKAVRGKTVTTVTRSKVIRRTNPRLVALYASKAGMRRLKYLGRGKFGERGRAKLFTGAEVNAVARVLRDTFPQELRGWTLHGDAPEESGPRHARARRRLRQGADPAEALYREQARRDSEVAHSWLGKQAK